MRMVNGTLIMLAAALPCYGQTGYEKVLTSEQIAPAGAFVEMDVPDTLDLAQRAQMALNYMVNNVEPDKAYSLYHFFQFDRNPPKVSQLTWNLPVKMLRTYPQVRTMCGSSEGLDIELKTMEAHLRQIDDHGILRYPYGGEGVPEKTSYAYTQGMLAIAIENWYQRSPDPQWLTWLAKLSDGLKEMAISVENRAYYPPESGYLQSGKWLWTTRGRGRQYMPYQPPAEPDFEQQGFEGNVKFDQSSALRALCKNYRYNHDASARELSDKIVRFMMKPGMWKDTTQEGYAGAERGIWEGHFHANVTALHGLMEYAVTTGDLQLLQIVRNGYHHTLINTVPGMGFSPFYTTPERFGRKGYQSGWCDTCNVADTIVLAVKLTDAGMGDYWDDVEYLVRNQLAEQQLIDFKQVKEIAGGGDENDAIFARFIGGFGGLEPTRAKPVMYGCCSANGPMGLYYAWHGITRFDKGVAKVNLFLNRTSEWMDVLSYLPYEGKVVLINKKANTAVVRIPGWLAGKPVDARVNGNAAKPVVIEGYLVFQNLQKGQTIELTFPIERRQEKHRIYGTDFTMTFRGSTIVDIQPREYPAISQDVQGFKTMVPVYSRKAMDSDRTPMVHRKMFVAGKVLPLQ